MNNCKVYPKYKKAGIEWLGEIPEHWERVKIKHVFKERVEKGFPKEPLLAATQKQGVVKKEDYATNTVTAQKDFHQLKLVRKGDFVISLRSFQGGIEISHVKGIISPAYTIMNPLEIVDKRYVKHLFKSKYFISGLTTFVTGIREGQNIDYSKFRRSFIPIPPKQEQTAIAQFLDQKTGEIARFIALKEKTIALLKERKTAIINQAVTCGLDENGKLREKPEVLADGSLPKGWKDSGVEWLGVIPEHWEVKKLKYIANKITDGEHIAPTFEDEGIPFLSAKDIRDKTINHDVKKFVSEKDAIKFRKRCKPELGDLLIVSRGATVGRVGLLDINKVFCLLGSVILFKPFSYYSSLYLYYILSSSKTTVQFTLSSSASAQEAIYLTDVSEVEIPISPYKESLIIESFLEKQTKNLNQSIIQAEKEITLIKEYQQSLISEAVTGRIDVRDLMTIDVE